MAHIDIDEEMKNLRKELVKRIEFLEGRLKYLEELITAMARDKNG